MQKFDKEYYVFVETPFGQIPLLKVDDVTLCQSDAFEFYLAKKFGKIWILWFGMTQISVCYILAWSIEIVFLARWSFQKETLVPAL